MVSGMEGKEHNDHRPIIRWALGDCKVPSLRPTGGWIGLVQTLVLPVFKRFDANKAWLKQG
jgi:hypothetical protein